MDVMSDKEIGELWADYHLMNRPVDNTIRALIHKLVEERARTNAMLYYRVNEPDSVAVQSCIVSALRDFGIPKETWK